MPGPTNLGGLRPPGRPQPPTSQNTVHIADEESAEQDREVLDKVEDAENEQKPQADESASVPTQVSNVLLMDPDVDSLTISSAAVIKERQVKIKMAKDHSTVIGGVRYNLKAGRVYPVPKGVADILSKSPLRLLDPII